MESGESVGALTCKAAFLTESGFDFDRFTTAHLPHHCRILHSQRDRPFPASLDSAATTNVAHNRAQSLGHPSTQPCVIPCRYGPLTSHQEDSVFQSNAPPRSIHCTLRVPSHRCYLGKLKTAASLALDRIFSHTVVLQHAHPPRQCPRYVRFFNDMLRSRKKRISIHAASAFRLKRNPPAGHASGALLFQQFAQRLIIASKRG